MNAKDLVKRTLSGEKHTRIPSGPLAVHYCAALAGVNLRDYSYHPQVLADAVIRYYDIFHPDAVWISNDTWITAEAMGAEVIHPAENQPICGSGVHFIRDSADIARIPPVDINHQGRIPIMLRALEIVKSAIGDEAFIVGCFDQSPFSLACELLGIEHAMTAVVTDRELIDSLIERCIEYAVAYGRAMSESGADMLSTGDSPAGLLSRDLYLKIARPAEQRVFALLKKETDIPVSLHICGAVGHIIGDMAKSGADVLEIDSMMPLEDACLSVPPEITLWGNLDPVGLLEYSEPARVIEEIRRITVILKKYRRERFVLSSGCGLTIGTNEKNLHIVCRSVRWPAPDIQC